MTHNVFGVGNALVDIQAQVPDSILEQIGFAKGIMTLIDNDVQQTVLAGLGDIPFNRCAGGSAANTIIGIQQLGGSTSYSSKVADDEIGQFFLSDLRDLGVIVDVPEKVGGQSGTCVVLITDDAQRTMLTNLAVSGELSADDIDEQHVAASQYVYIEGYLFGGETTKAAAIKAIDIAHANGVKTSLTVSDPFLVDLFRDQFWDLIKGPIDLLFCNLDEARSLTGKEDAEECARAIHEFADVALTMGSDGSLLMHDGELIKIEGVPTQAVDTTGAGDMFAGALLYGITNGLTWKQAGTLASHAASRVVSQLGARLASPLSAEEVSSIVSNA
jgi:sugar/nucleoside kinase (ribokinase family)